MVRAFFFFNDTATTEIYTLSLHDALPIYQHERRRELLAHVDDGNSPRDAHLVRGEPHAFGRAPGGRRAASCRRSEEHTSELQSRLHLVCRLLLEKKKKVTQDPYQYTLVYP